MRLQAICTDPFSRSVLAHFVRGRCVEYFVLGTIGVVAEPGLDPFVHAALFDRSRGEERRADAPGERKCQQQHQAGLHGHPPTRFCRGRAGILVGDARTWTFWIQLSGPFSSPGHPLPLGA